MVSRDRRVRIAHDYISQKGGAERVALSIAQRLGSGSVLTALYEPNGSFPGYRDISISPSWLNRFKFFRKDPRRALPLLPLAWAWRRKVDADAVLCSSSGWSHAIRVTAGTAKVVYCHNPPRWLYQPEDYFRDQPAVVRRLARLLTPWLMRWDKKAASTATTYIANSRAVATRIQEAYGVTPSIIHPHRYR